MNYVHHGGLLKSVVLCSEQIELLGYKNLIERNTLSYKFIKVVFVS